MDATVTSDNAPDLDARPSIIHGPPISEQPFLGALTLPGYLREVTARFSGKDAMIGYLPDGTVEHWTYDDLWARALDVARALAARGVGKDSRVGVMMTNRPEWLATFFGIGLCGGVAVTLSTFSTATELDYLLKAGCIEGLLFERKVLAKDFGAVLEALAPEIATAKPRRLAAPAFPYLRWIVAVGEGGWGTGGGEGPGKSGGGAIEAWADFLAEAEQTPAALVEAMAEAVKPADMGAIFFSSGSTGKAKGIMSAHRALAIQLWRWLWFDNVGDDVRSLSVNGFFWSGNFCQTLGPTFSSGGVLVLQPTFEPEETLRLMQKERVNLPVGWPHQWARLEQASNWAETDLSSLKYIDTQYPLARHPTVTTTYVEPRWAYGNTETFTIVTGFPANSPIEIAGDTHGVALPGAVVKVVDPETGRTTPRGMSGEIAVKGATLMLGYLGIPAEETLDGEGFLRTGDGGRIDERDRLIWEGRITDMIKTGGANVSPVEIDTEIAAYPGVKLSRAVGVPHETLGELIVACVVKEPGAAVDEASIRDYLKPRLASYKIPRRVIFVQEDELSLTSSAKVKTSALRELAQKRLAAEKA